MNQLAAQTTGVIIELDYLGSGVFLTQKLLVCSYEMLAQTLVKAKVGVMPVRNLLMSFDGFTVGAWIKVLSRVDYC